MTHQMDHSAENASACGTYQRGRDSVTVHRRLITCIRCRTWLRDAIHSAQARELEKATARFRWRESMR